MSSPELDGADISDRIQLLDADSVNATHAQTRSLGRMADLCAWLAGAQSNCPPTFPERTRLIVFSGTHRSGAAVSSSVVALTPDPTTLVCVEVPDGQQIRYEVQPQGPTAPGARTAGNLSRRASGFFNLAWNPGYTLSVIDASGLP